MLLRALPGSREWINNECSGLNCGSSSVKFRLIATDLDLIAQNAHRRLAKGTIEAVGLVAFETCRTRSFECLSNSGKDRTCNRDVSWRTENEA